MTANRRIILIVFAPALVHDDHRPMAVVHAMEHAFPGLRLGWAVSDDHQIISLPQREQWIAQARRNGGFPLVCNNDEHYPVMVSGLELSAMSGPGSQALFEVHAELPLDARGLAAAADVLEAVAEAAHAFWGHATPSRAALDIARQTQDPELEPKAPPRGLPAINVPRNISSPEIPQHLGWLNHWSDAAARAIGFPDPARDAELLSRSRRTATGGWVVQLTDAPLDLDNPSHLDALKRAYAHFPEIGGRSTSGGPSQLAAFDDDQTKGE